VTIFLKNLGELMVSYLKSVEKHASDIPYIAFKLYNNIVVPSNWVDLEPYQPKRGVAEVNFRILKKVSMTSASPLSSFCSNACNNIPSMAWVSYKKSSIPIPISLSSSPTCDMDFMSRTK
jgi:endogenous inhibitor of DNA gyrase (YacG/DUF329 family)